MLKNICNSIDILIRTDDRENNKHLEFIESNVENSLKNLNISFEDVFQELSPISFTYSNNDGVIWKVVCTGCYLISVLTDYLNNDQNALISVSQSQSIRKLLQFIFSNGIHPSLLPGVGIFSKDKESTTALNDLDKYNRLKAVSKLLCKVHGNPELRTILLVNHFSDYLAALYQLSFAHLVKPNTTLQIDNKPFVITQQLWEALAKDQKEFREVLKEVIGLTNRQVIIKELIVLQGAKTHPLPNFMKRALGKQLSECLTAPGGLQGLIQCFLDSSHLDIGSQWKHVDMIVRLVSVKHGSMTDEEYLNNISEQLSNIYKTYSNDCYVIVVAACIASLYEKFNGNDHTESLVQMILSPFLYTTKTSSDLNNSDIYGAVHKIDLCFCHPKLSMPLTLLTPIIHCLFKLRVCTGNMLINLSSKVDNLISKYFLSKCCEAETFFDAMIFENPSPELPTDKLILFQIVNDEILGKPCNNLPEINVDQNINTLIEIADKSDKMMYSLFCYLLNALSKSNYLEKNNADCLETDYDVLCITKALENLVSKESVLLCFKSDPSVIVCFINKYLDLYSANIQKKKSLNNECLTISLVLLSILVNDTEYDKRDLLTIEMPLKTIIKHTREEEVQYLCKEILTSILGHSTKQQKQESRFENAMNQICDPLLPVRAHGIIELTKLLEQEDIETLSKKQFVLCIFQENLKDSDSYIYLAAIKGLSTLGMICTEDVLEILSREYLNGANNLAVTEDKEDENLKLRMKVGEILLKVTKNLGDKALDHKVILLNTFLSGCHDTDDFIKASSLSNLAELCRVLSYKLGDIIFDILKSVENTIQYDKSVECRRAAVLVISSLIKGLGKESLFFLKDALLPIYRCLKKLYGDEKEDATVKLHAQIALEELNDIMREIMAPYLKHSE